MILLGTLVLMAMALVLDAGLGFVERRLSSHSRRKFPTPARAAAGGAAALAGLALVIYLLLPTDTSGQLILYDGDYTEVKLMHSMAEQLVEDKTDLEVVILDQMTQVNNYNELKADDPSCDLMFSYDGTVLTTFLGMDTADIPEGESLYDFVNQAVGEQEGLRLLGKVGLNNTYSIGVTQEVVDTYGVSKISELVPIAGELDFGAEHEFYTSEGSMKYDPFVAFYGLNFQSAVPVDVVLRWCRWAVTVPRHDGAAGTGAAGGKGCFGNIDSVGGRGAAIPHHDLGIAAAGAQHVHLGARRQLLGGLGQGKRPRRAAAGQIDIGGGDQGHRTARGYCGAGYGQAAEYKQRRHGQGQYTKFLFHGLVLSYPTGFDT